MPPTKDHTQLGGDEPVIDCSEDTDVTRQEFKQDADLNYMLSRLGVTQPRGTPTFGEWDDSIDLQTALASVREAQEAYSRVPQEIRDRFTSMEQLLAAVENGSLVIKDEEAPEEPPSELETLRAQVAELRTAHDRSEQQPK